MKLWREESREFVGVGIVELDDESCRLIFHVDDEDERKRVAGVFKETGEVLSKGRIRKGSRPASGTPRSRPRLRPTAISCLHSERTSTRLSIMHIGTQNSISRGVCAAWLLCLRTLANPKTLRDLHI